MIQFSAGQKLMAGAYGSPMDDVDREIIQELILKKMEDIKVKWVTRNDYPGAVNE